MGTKLDKMEKQTIDIDHCCGSDTSKEIIANAKQLREARDDLHRVETETLPKTFCFFRVESKDQENCACRKNLRFVELSENADD